jgi:hypothetical protein
VADPAPKRLTPYLVVRVGVQPEQIVIWDTVEITVGRHDTQDIVVPDPEVSRRHAVLQHRGQEFLVEDLGTPLRTLVNGEPIKSQVLAPGDVISVGLLQLEFQMAEESPRPSGSTRFASQLKSLAFPEDEGEGGRTMLGVAMELPLVPSPAADAPAPPLARVVAADGSLEEASEAEMSLAAPGEDDFGPTPPVPVRDLDAVLDSLGSDLDPVGQAALSSPGHTAPTRPRIVSLPNPSGGDVATVTLSVQIVGPPAQVAALAEALCDKRIDVPPLVLRVKASVD